MATFSFTPDQVSNVMRSLPATIRNQCIYDGAILTVPDAHASAISAIDENDNRGMLKAVAAAKRWDVENGGCPVVGFGVVPTDERTRAVLTAAYIKASTNPAYTIPKWKVAPGVYTTLTAAQIIAIADAVEAHVQACFSVNGDVDDEIAAETITTIEEINAAAWPANS